jgi:hypothetical protein
MPPFVDVSNALKADIEAHQDKSALILTNTRIVHVVVWATGIPMHRFVTEMNPAGLELPLVEYRSSRALGDYRRGRSTLACPGKMADRELDPDRKLDSTGRVHLYRRP